MSYGTESTLQEQMAGPSRPRFTGWLTMAPEVDPAPRPSSVSNGANPSASASTQHTLASAPGTSSSSFTSYSQMPVTSTHSFGYLGQQVKLPQRKKRRAVFQVGSPVLSEDEASTGSRSSRASSDAPEFDVRASFAPLPVYGKPKAAADQPSQRRGVGDGSFLAYSEQSSSIAHDSSASAVPDQSSDEKDEGLSFGGRRWKGKTVHAVEQELEALRDERLMSHAPDAAYLASRLEGVRRNLEIEERRPRYVPYDEDVISDEEPAELAPHASEAVRQLYPFQHMNNGAPTLPHRPVSNASSVSLVEGETPHDLDFGLQFDPSATHIASFDEVMVHDLDEVAMPPVSTLLAPSSAKQIDPAARAAALDARIEVRPLRRGDLEQVRDLHAFHGDSDRSPNHGETYASTASFLLRLLVDDRHVCLVAVAKPIPEPSAPLPSLSRLDGSGASPDSLSPSGADSSTSDHAPGSELKSLHLDSTDNAAASDVSSLSSSPGYGAKSLFSTPSGVAPAAPQTRMINPRDAQGRINNTPATSVFTDIFAERGHPSLKASEPDLPGPTDTEAAPVKRVLSLPPKSGVETETILGVVSAQLTVVTAASEDHLFDAPKKQDGGEDVTSLVDIHLLTLATAPEERGQGLGAKLLAALHAECMSKARLMAMRLRSRPPGRQLPSITPLSPKFIDELALSDAACVPSSSDVTRSPYLKALGGSSLTLTDLRAPTPASGKFLARTYLEVHPSNVHAIALYRAHGFTVPRDDSKAVKRGFYRGDIRIATSERTKRGGTDAWILQRFDGVLNV